MILSPYNPFIHLKIIKSIFRRSIEEKQMESPEENDIQHAISTDVLAVEEQQKGDITILQDLATLITDYDLYVLQFDDANLQSIIKHMQDSMIDIMVKNGAEEFTDTDYNSLRDIVVPFRIVEEMTPITHTIRPGIKYKNMVLLRSHVAIE